jgi:2-methylcitrate dehydratase PrpD
MAKPFHAGKAAMDGILSALLASDGFTACKDVLDEGSGFGRMLSPQFDHFQLNVDLGKRFNVLDVSFKPYAACLAIHPVISGLVLIGKEHRPDPQTIERIDLKVAPICVALGGNADPRSALEGKFSVNYCSALAISEGHVGKSLFVDELVNAPHIRRLMERTNIREDGTFQESEALVEVVLKDGKRFTEHVTAPKGDPRNPLDFDEVSEKVFDLTKGLLSEEQTEKIISGIQNLEKAANILGILEICHVAETVKRADP